MIQAIFGKKGSGKTKRIIDLANDAIKAHHGDVVFIDDDTRYMFDLRHEIRFMNAGEFGVCNPHMLLGFLCGLFAQNFDVKDVFIDGFFKLVKVEPPALEEFFVGLEKLSTRYNINFIIAISGDMKDMPEFMQKYAM